MKKMLALGLLLAGLPLLTSCDENAQRGRAAIEIVSVAEGGVFVSGQVDAGPDKEVGTEDDFQPTGHVPVMVRNSPNPLFTESPGAMLSDFHVTSIQVEWSSPDATADAFLDQWEFTQGYDVVIPSNSEVEFLAFVLPLAAKQDPFLEGLLTGATDPFFASARLTLTGNFTGDERSVRVRGSVIVEFVDVIVQD